MPFAARPWDVSGIQTVTRPVEYDRRQEVVVEEGERLVTW